MLKRYKNLLFFGTLLFIFGGCSSKDYHEEMIDKTKSTLNKQDYDEIKKSYSDSFPETATVS